MKSPRLDGYNFKFIKKFWDLLKVDVKMTLDEFHIHSIILGGSNSSFICLVPKVEDPIHLGKYRPISLVGSMYKILAKILARILPKVIDERQSALLSGRSLLHSALVSNDAVDKAKKKKKLLSFQGGFSIIMLRRLDFCLNV